MSKTTKERKKILANIGLEIYIGEQNVFVKVSPPDEEGFSNWPRIQTFYRWAAAEGFMPSEVWNEKLGYGVLPLRYFASLRADFSTKVISKEEFFLGVPA